MPRQNSNKATKQVYTQGQAYIIPIFTNVFAENKKSLGNYYYCSPSFILYRDVLLKIYTLELIKTPNDVSPRNYPTEKCRR